MDPVSRRALTGIEMLELELVARDFVDVLNTGSVAQLHPFLTEDVVYAASPGRTICGRESVLAMIADIHATFAEWSTALTRVAVAGEVVLAEQELRLRLSGCSAKALMGFASYRFRGFRISEWHQLHA